MRGQPANRKGRASTRAGSNFWLSNEYQASVFITAPALQAALIAGLAGLQWANQRGLPHTQPSNR
jgi:hypothetical protein